MGQTKELAGSRRLGFLTPKARSTANGQLADVIAATGEEGSACVAASLFEGLDHEYLLFWHPGFFCGALEAKTDVMGFRERWIVFWPHSPLVDGATDWRISVLPV